MFKCDTDLKFMLALLDTERNTAVGNILAGHKNKDEKAIEAAFEEYTKLDRLIDLGLKLLVDANLKEFNWKYLACHGWPCIKDFEWFKKELDSEGVFKNDYHKNWKEWQKEFNRKSNDDFEPVSEYVVMANAANAANAAKVSEEFSKKSKRKSNRDGFRSSLEN